MINSKLSYVQNISKLDSVLFFDAKLILLETNKQSLLKSIEVLEFGERYLYILDKDQEAILIFDKAGRFVGKIDRLNPGPEEFNL